MATLVSNRFFGQIGQISCGIFEVFLEKDMCIISIELWNVSFAVKNFELRLHASVVRVCIRPSMYLGKIKHAASN